jgi:hypothetical protein
MPSIAESKRQVTEGLSADYEHDAILASLQDEIDKHNRETDEIRKERPHKRRRHHDDRDGESKSHRERHLRFRFKSGVEEPKPKKRSKRSHSPKPASPDPDVAHPFPREPTDPDAPSLPSNTAAFQTSLFDALADDEAASYWESVYSQPIHVYSRPAQQTESGEFQDMDDETYAAYVQRKMWEKQNPEIVIERERMERKRKEEKEAKERRRRVWPGSKAGSPSTPKTASQSSSVSDRGCTDSELTESGDTIDDRCFARYASKTRLGAGLLHKHVALRVGPMLAESCPLWAITTLRAAIQSMK